MDLGLRGKVVVVTGGTGGIGEAAVRAFAAEGARVVATYASNKDRAAALAEELGAGQVLPVRYDLADPGSVERLVPEVTARCGGIDVLVANAVRRPARPPGPAFDEIDPAEWADTLRSNVDPTLRTVQLAVAAMRGRGGGRVVLVSSHVATRGDAGQEAYGAAKAALHGFAVSLARSVGPHGVLVNVVSPGLTATPDALAYLPAPVLAAAATRMPTGRLCDPHDVARLIVFYASAANQNISGEVVSMVGG
ncbi:SDR family oxidoreductase [Couchioplanes caeruleus]|uniref:SDR family oxidoreductase n=1 Tax=Couchioplanes caeruleus TaxID=56438 RepID=UPI0020BFD4A3|nr:SDR family oxidoreductase [Couchioplanes caeruleus]UQU67670.1 SDR family oxidoreductase [Couchioplanes caeruleus]